MMVSYEQDHAFVCPAAPGQRLLGLSDLRVPYPALRNPRAAVAEQAIEDVARRVGVLREGAAHYFNAFNQASGFTYPRASAERLMACVEWCDWLFFFDDLYDVDRAFTRREAHLDRVASRYLALLGGAPCPALPRPLALFACDLSDRLAALASPAWRRRFLQSVEDYLTRGVLRTARNFAAGEVPDLASYVHDREFDSAVLTTLDMIEVATGRELPDEVAADPTLQRMRRVCTRVVAFVNDIVSYQKEVLKHENPNNLLHVLMVNEGCTLELALSRTVEIVNASVAQFEALRGELPVWAPRDMDAVREYVEGMEHWMRGNLDWSLQSARYCSLDSPFAELRSCRSVAPLPPDAQAG